MMKRYTPLVAITFVPLLGYSSGVTPTSAPHSQNKYQHQVSKEKPHLSYTTATSSPRTDGELIGDSAFDVELGVPDELSVEETYRSARDAFDAVDGGKKL